MTSLRAAAKGLIFIASLTGSVCHAFDSQTLADCLIERAVRLNQEPTLQSEATLSDTKAGYLPTLKTTLSENRSQTGSFQQTYDNLGVSLDQKVFDASLNAGIDAAHAGVKAAQNNLRQQTLSDSVTAVSALSALQKLYDQKVLIRSQISIYEDLVRLFSTANHVGLSDSNDLLQAKATLVADQIQLQQTDYDIANAKQSFLVKYGFEPPALLEIESSALAPIGLYLIPK